MAAYAQPVANGGIFFRDSYGLSAEPLDAGRLNLVIEETKRYDPELWEHVAGVRRILKPMCELSGCSPEESNLLDQAAIIHDYGKIGNPLFLKDGPFTPQESMKARDHVRHKKETGANPHAEKIGRDSHDYKAIAPYRSNRDRRRLHQEPPNGIERRSGTDRRSGAFPVEHKLGPMLAIADSLDAAMRCRCYHESLGPWAAYLMTEQTIDVHPEHKQLLENALKRLLNPIEILV